MCIDNMHSFSALSIGAMPLPGDDARFRMCRIAVELPLLLTTRYEFPLSLFGCSSVISKQHELGGYLYDR